MMSLGYRKKQSIALAASAIAHAAIVAFVLLSPREEKPEPVVVEFLESSATDVPTPSPDSRSAVSNEQKASGDAIEKRAASAQKQTAPFPKKLSDSRDTAIEPQQKNSREPETFAFSTRESLHDNWSNAVEVETNKAHTGEIDGSTTDGINGDPMTSLETASGGFSSAVQYSNHMNLEFTNESLGFFQALHRRVDGPLVYPEDFSRQRLTGKVRIEAELRSDGTLVKFLSFVADNDILQVYSLAYLSHVFSQPLPSRSHLKYERVVVSFDFDFRIRVQGTNPVTLETGYRKNHLLFARESLVDPLLNEKLDEIFTHYVPPIIPLPGGFYVDFIAAFKYFKNLKEGNPTESEARLRRIETLHEKLKQSIRSQKPS